MRLKGEPIVHFAVIPQMLGLLLSAGCSANQQPVQSESVLSPVPHVVTADIAAGIENHIAEQSKQHGGYFTLPYEGGVLKLKLVRVHLEYLANLGPRRHFACVDLASTQGDVYDVDFFLSGDPGDMTVTETTIHKLNGQPFYVWKQKEDKTWVRQSVDEADRTLLGVIEGRDSFEFLYQVQLPQLDGEARMWIPLPQSDAFQTVTVDEIKAPGERQFLTDARFGNRVLFLELTPEDGGKAIELRFEVRRTEKSAYEDEKQNPQDSLAAERLVPDSDEFERIAHEVLGDRQGDLVRARLLYDHTIDRMRYMRYGEGFGQGDATYACDSATGNCTDFHAYFIALARAADIPARFAIGAAIPSERNEGVVDGYHCWAEFYAEGKWWPVDISEADKYAPLSTYYFGHNPANRVELSRGRDLVVDPGPVSGPINYLVYPVLEVEGRPVSIKPVFSFSRKGS